MERARALTSQLLTFAKGGAPMKKQQRFSPFIEETVKFALSGTSARPEFTIQENLWKCEFDSGQIGQVLDNLIINAQQAMPQGGTIFVNAENCTICTSTHPQLASGRYVKISIRDQGTGIPKEIMNKIFDPFFTTKAKGHGLGLSTSYSIIKRHGGSIEVSSEAGKGSIFTVYLPALTNASIIEKDCQDANKSASGLILVMDDEEVIRDTIELMLKALGYDVRCVTNAQDALMEFKRSAFAAIILDLTIPGGAGGREVVAEIRKINTTVPVFVSSGYADNPIMAEPEQYGFNGSICKPFKKTELACMLEKGMKS
jgi:CheY-like chemotaxis protein